MKRTFRLFALLIVSLIVFPGFIRAQELTPEMMAQIPQLPVDENVRIGKLSNGLTYYIRHNEYPKGQADFYIAQKVGSILEEDNQRGLAHFLEHMCFNGTTHFPGKNLINWLETVGVKFGRNLNADTSVDETVYNISNVPVARTGVQDSCLLILHDWANDLLLEDAEIDAERKVIHEEWRQSMVGQMRIIEKLLPTMYPNSRYGYRLPIGTMDVVDNFPYKALRDYYEKWYRPDQQAIIVVGDISVDYIEGKIKEMFADIEMPDDAAERVYYPVDDHKGTIYAIGHDKEQTNNIVQLMFLSDPLPMQLRNTQVKLMTDYIESMIEMMLSNRFNDMMSDPNAPFAAASAGFGEYFLAKTKEAFTVTGVAKDGKMEPVLEAIYRETLRAARGGFTEGEYQRAKSEYLSRYEKAYNNRATEQSEYYVQEYVNNFIDGDPIPGIAKEYEYAQLFTQQIPLAMINQAFAEAITPDNRVVMALLADNADGSYPTEETFTAVLGSVDQEDIKPYVDDVKSEPLIEKMPKAGKIVKTAELKQWDATEWTLSNGARVIVKPTKFKQDEIKFWAGAVGGYGDMDASYDNTIKFLPFSLQSMGLGNYTNSDLQKYLSGKQVAVSPSFDNYTRDIEGMTTPKDLKTMMELIYMTFTNPNFSPEEFEALQKTYAGVMHNQESNPQYIFSKELSKDLYESPREGVIDVNAINSATREQTIALAKEMTKNAADYTFVFVGNVDVDSLKPMVEQYIASLPGNAKTAVKEVKSFNPAYSAKGGTAVDVIKTKMETPQSYVFIGEFARLPYSMKNQQLSSVAGQILTKRLVDKVREEMGAVYSISANGQMTRIAGKNNIVLQSGFPMKPELQQEVLDAIKAEIDDMTRNVSEEELSKIKEYMVKNYTEARELNEGWLGGIGGWTRNNVDTFNGNIESINALTVNDVMDFMKQINGQGNYRVFILAPEQ